MDQEDKLLEAIQQLQQRGFNATYEYPGFLLVHAWAFGIEDGELQGNTLEATPTCAEGLRQDMPIADAIQQFLEGEPKW